MTRARITTLFPNAVLDRLQRLRLLSRSRRTNRSRGEHLSGRGGASTEFCDYRNYAPGDDTRFVDWNIFARLHRPYLKQFHREEERHVVLLVDASRSMAFDGKIERARELAAALGVLGLLNGERVSVYTGTATPRLSAARGRASLRALFAAIEGLQAGGAAPVEDAVTAMLRRHRGRGACYVVSDFLTFGDLTRPFNLLHAAGLELMGLQVLSPAEVEPPVTDDLRLVDSETAGALDVTAAGDLLSLYQEYRRAYEQQLALACSRRSGRFVSIRSDATLEDILFDTLRRQAWIG